MNPAIVVVTPIRNEAWVLDAYLACTSTWADYIILADQHSTDGSRNIAKKYPKVTLINNPYEEMNQSEARRLLFKEVDKIKGDKIVFAIDADEFLSQGFARTQSWHEILNSKPNSIFCFKWLNLYGDFEHSLPFKDSHYMDWCCHLDTELSLEEEYYKRERNAVHECRIPCLNESECSYTMVDDIQFIHLARLNLLRTRNKEDFYQVATVDKREQQISAVSLYRSYHRMPQIEQLSNPVKLFSKDEDVDYSSLIKKDDVGLYYIDEIVRIINRKSIAPFSKLDIWDNPYLKQMGINYTPTILKRILFYYLRHTSTQTNLSIIHLIDGILKRFV